MISARPRVEPFPAAGAGSASDDFAEFVRGELPGAGRG
ncbi:hypothetical protein FHX42_004971 [Saccharopolyspora lacisalsi]|uniref:Uncharacterized protein n=1 Tax=Halosaccharopolyspora lacisalsi TaxID=1000566 RepID=A0A839E6Q3_9PSEU|nr:hypothetical protein [Halosaccharopolyspora lacisalsi]